MKILITKVPESKSLFARMARNTLLLGLKDAADIHDEVMRDGQAVIDITPPLPQEMRELRRAGVAFEEIKSGAPQPKTVIVTHSGYSANVYETVGEVSELMWQARTDPEMGGLVPLEPNMLIAVDRIEMIAEIQEN
jgi:hypothetical protein